MLGIYAITTKKKSLSKSMQDPKGNLGKVKTDESIITECFRVS